MHWPAIVFQLVVLRLRIGYPAVASWFHWLICSGADTKLPAFYLHVLGTPPAFILSQDQTLIKITVYILNSFCHWQIYWFLLFSYYNLSYSAYHISSSCSVFKDLCHSQRDNYISISWPLLTVNTFSKNFYFLKVFTFGLYKKIRIDAPDSSII